jgi:hypothetical protein
MNCTDFEKRLHEQFEAARLDETADLAEHARQCPVCGATLERFQLLSDALGAWRTQVPDVELVEAVLAVRGSDFADFEAARPAAAMPQVVAARSAPRPVSTSKASIIARPVLRPGPFRSTPVRWLVAGGVAALLAVAFSLLRLHWNAPPSGATPQLAGEQAIEPERSRDDRTPGSPARVAIDPLPAAPDQPEARYYDLAQKAAGALGEVTAYVMPGSSPRPMPPSQARPDGAGAWIDGLRHQLKPIGRSLDHAFDFLWEAGQSADSSKT